MSNITQLLKPEIIRREKKYLKSEMTKIQLNRNYSKSAMNKSDLNQKYSKSEMTKTDLSLKYTESERSIKMLNRQSWRRVEKYRKTECLLPFWGVFILNLVGKMILAMSMHFHTSFRLVKTDVAYVSIGPLISYTKAFCPLNS